MSARPFLQRQRWMAALAVLACVAIAIAATVALMHGTFQRTLMPQVLAKADTVARSANTLFAQAASQSMPLEKLVGVTDVFAEIAAAHPELTLLAVTTPKTELFRHGSANIRIADAPHKTLIPLAGYESAEARLTVVTDSAFVARIFSEMLLDLVVVLVVALFISLELTYLLAGGLVRDISKLNAQLNVVAHGRLSAMPAARWIGQGLATQLNTLAKSLLQRAQTLETDTRTLLSCRHEAGHAKCRAAIAALRDARRALGGDSTATIAIAGDGLGPMRAPFFLVMFAEDLTRPFLPLFAGSLPVGPLPVALSPNMVVGLPIFLFMLIVALSQPVLGAWSENAGRRRSFLIGAAVALIAHALSASAGTLVELLLWRSAAGAAWAVAFVATQGYVLDTSSAANRTRTLAEFVTVIMVASLCGPAIGGILADGLGHRGTFLVSGLLALIGFALAWRRMPKDASEKHVVAAQSASLLAPLANRRFVLLLLLAAVPAKLALIAFCYYLIPLHIANGGASTATAGRVIMLYSIMMVLLAPLAAEKLQSLKKMQDRPETMFVTLGLLFSGAAGLVMAFPLGLAGPVLVATLLGVGQALSISPQAALVAEVCADEIKSLGQSAVYGVYRMVERFGNASGPLVAAALVEWTSFRTAFVAIGVALIVCGGLFAIAFRPLPRIPQLKGAT